ncbi:S-layer homology domain-containing protein [Alkalihalobacillus sp. MEB130]|uniref:S-layer homology domain-containing protein n=1 Tax=Alkalihalobacillus sp. MEB130 TaxID=2976704 RepID=UPI0028DFFA14|nr:S-layer homology domain-containing protein [Alkalihalobacillus sp. MEB130]MDT8858833.1 S-layer homology domain-containing protein [Alkalihalobacillus sp. MEB130]
MKRILCLLCMVVLILSSCGFFQGADDGGTAHTQNQNQNQNQNQSPQNVAIQATQFTDVSRDYWAREEIHFLFNQEIIRGYNDGTFRPGNTVTRSQAATMIAGALDLELEGRPAPNFVDIREGFHAYDVIAAVADEGIITGREGRFMPNAPLTRGQMAAILTRAFSLTGTWNREFNDVRRNHTFYHDIQALAANNITTGFSSDRTFRPSQPTTRAQFSVFLARTLDDAFKPGEPFQDGDLTLHHLNVGQGDSTLITTPNGSTILVDAGTRTAGQAVVQYLKQAGIDTIDRLVMTHPHADHIGGAVSVMQNFTVRQVIDSGAEHDSQTFINYLQHILDNDIPIHFASPGDTIDVDPAVTINIVNSEQPGDTLNNASVSLHMRYGNFSYLITGDAELAAERRMVDQFQIASDVLRVGHHGSVTSSNPFFLQAVQPTEGIISYGEGNAYGHPHEEAINRLRNNGVEQLYSTTGDAVLVVSDGSAYHITGRVQESVPSVEPEPDPTEPEPVAPGPEPVQPAPTPTPDGPHFPININTADWETLQHITGVGPVIAENIIQYRQTHGNFTSVEQLVNVPRIGPATLDAMRHQITI